MTGQIEQFYERRQLRSVMDRYLMIGLRVVVPTTPRQLVLRQFRTGRPGTSRLKSIARNYVYWPGMNQQIEDLVKLCATCQEAMTLGDQILIAGAKFWFSETSR